MDSATLKFAITATVAIALLYILGKKPERFQAYEVEGDNAAYDPPAAPPAVAKKNARKGGLLKAAKGANPAVVGSVDPNSLPKPPADDGFGAFAPGVADITGQNFVDASRYVSLGAMTTKRNLNRDLRSEIPIPKNAGVSPWLNSTIEQQPARQPLE